MVVEGVDIAEDAADMAVGVEAEGVVGDAVAVADAGIKVCLNKDIKRGRLESRPLFYCLI